MCKTQTTAARRELQFENIRSTGGVKHCACEKKGASHRKLRPSPAHTTTGLFAPLVECLFFFAFWSQNNAQHEQLTLLTTTFFVEYIIHQTHLVIMISDSSAIPTLHGGQIDLARVMAPTHTSNRRTKIVCTMGPACWSKDNIGILMDAGMNVARFNFSHGDHEGHSTVLDRLREVASEKSRNIAGELLLLATGRICTTPLKQFSRCGFRAKRHRLQ